MSGLVSLVGAGPGDPDLLTVAAVKRLAAAEVVLYDALVPEAILELAPRALRLSVGKRAHRHSMPQQTIDALLVRLGRRGRRVVRLKGGDPFVLGRGGEEALALAAAGVPFEVVPGVSSALAAPALAGIPVTHRGLATGFAVIAGQTSGDGTALDTVAPNALTLVVLMGLARRAEIARSLLSRGWRAGTPAAVLLSAGTTDEERWIGTLEALAKGRDALEPGERPGTLVIGDVVDLAHVLAPREVPAERIRHVGRR